MSIVKAIARVRKGARDRGLGGALASLGSELRSDAIPERLRDAAQRLATLLNPQGAPSKVVSLEQALEAKASVEARGQSEAASHASSPSGASAVAEHAHLTRAEVSGVCPFTGMRADGTAELPPTPSPEVEARGSAREQTSVEARGSAREQTSVEARGSAREQTSIPRAPEVLPPTHGSASAAPPAVTSEPQASGPAARVRKPRARGDALHTPAAHADAATRDPKRREKHKEGLAGARSVENTSGRSATRSAQKQPRSRAQASRKKV